MVVNNKRYQQTDKYSTKLSEAMQNHLDPFVEVWEQKSYDLDFFALECEPYRHGVIRIRLNDDEVANGNETEGNYIESPEEEYSQYLKMLKENGVVQFEGYLKTQASDRVLNAFIYIREESRITEINQIYSFQFKFLNTLKIIIKDLFVFRAFWWNPLNTALWLDIDGIKNIRTLINFCRECSLALKNSSLTFSDIQQNHLISLNNLEENCKIFIEQFLRRSDYNKTTIPLLRILINSGLLSDLKNIFNILKNKLIFLSLPKHKSPHDFQTLDEFQKNNYLNDEFVSSLTEEVKNRIEDIDKKQEVFNTPEFEQALNTIAEIPEKELNSWKEYLEVNNKPKLTGGYGRQEKLRLGSKIYEFADIEAAFKKLSTTQKGKDLKARFKAYADMYQKGAVYNYHDEYIKAENKANIQKKVSKSISSNAEFSKFIPILLKEIKN